MYRKLDDFLADLEAQREATLKVLGALTDASLAQRVTPEGRTLGRLACVYKPNFIVGFRRRIMMNLDYLSYYDAFQMTASVRLAFNKQDNDSVSAGYNIAV